MFNAKQRTAICFDKVSLRKTKDGAKIAKMRFAVRLEPDIARCCPPEVRAAYEAIETLDNKISYVELDKIINGVNVEFYNLPDSMALSLSMQSATLDKLAVERKVGERAEPHLLFTIEVFLEDKDRLRYWLVDNVFNQLWAKFEVAQMTLMPGMADAMADFADAATQGGTSVTISAGGTSATITPETAKRIKESAGRCPYPGCKFKAEHDGGHSQSAVQ